MLYVDGQETFDGQIIETILRSVEGVEDLERNPDDFSLLMARYSKGTCSNLIELKKSREVIGRVDK